MNSAAKQLITQTYQRAYRPATPATFKPIEAEVSDPIDPYEEFIFKLASKFTNSREEAEAAVLEMNADIRRCAGKGELATTNEDRMIARIAFRKLIDFLR